MVRMLCQVDVGWRYEQYVTTFVTIYSSYYIELEAQLNQMPGHLLFLVGDLWIGFLEISFLVKKIWMFGYSQGSVRRIHKTPVVWFAEFPPWHLYKAWQMPACVRRAPQLHQLHQISMPKMKKARISSEGCEGVWYLIAKEQSSLLIA